MPYIDNKDGIRELLDGEPLPYTKGELAYAVARAVDNFLISVEDVGYQELSDAVAALNDVAHEVRRRFLDPYEDKKIKENGEVFTWLAKQK